MLMVGYDVFFTTITKNAADASATPTVVECKEV